MIASSSKAIGPYQSWFITEDIKEIILTEDKIKYLIFCITMKKIGYHYFIKFQWLTKDVLIDITNNIAESFNRLMNNHLESSHPGSGVFVAKLK